MGRSGRTLYRPNKIELINEEMYEILCMGRNGRAAGWLSGRNGGDAARRLQQVYFLEGSRQAAVGAGSTFQLFPETPG